MPNFADQSGRPFAWRYLLAGLALSLVVACSEEPGNSSPTQSNTGPTAMAFDPLEASIAELQQAMTEGALTATELVEFYLDRIERFDQTGVSLNAIRITNPDALAIAVVLDQERAQSGARGPLHGIPVLVKDNYETLEMTTTAGSELLANLQTGRDAEAVTRLRNAGAIILGKTNMHEFAYGITTAGSLFGQTRNPYAPSRNAGGSSGGTGAAVAANFAAVGMGSDTCGSIRIPASHNNLVGLRGTQGLSSRFGIIPLSTTMDIGGPLARNVHDLALVLDATVGSDAKDPITERSQKRIPASYADALDANALDGARIGVVTPVFNSTTNVHSEAVRETFELAMAELRSLGVSVVELELDSLNELLAGDLNGFRILIEDFKWDIQDYLAQFDEAQVHSVDDIVASGRAHPSIRGSLELSQATQRRRGPEYLRELARHLQLRQLLELTLRDRGLDALAYPTIGQEPLPLGQHDQGGSNCRLSAKSGLPAISIPVGFTQGQLPVGVDLLGSAWSEQRLLDLAYSYETKANKRRAPALD